MSNWKYEVLVSIVSGTYNRLKYLQNMVDTVRTSVGVGISYEIILVDGGSTDGTQAWCKSQDDIVLIEQKKLLGAVKAFNAGFKMAKGKYVVVANDDIAFMDDAIMTAIGFMETHLSVGIGCFCQDRGGREFHIEFMPALRDGHPVSVPYGQVCIIPKWIGDKVGWWGNYLHTYAADNEMSCNVYELGYTVEKCDPCACIHDYVAKDDLRISNMGSVENHPSQGHPDSNAWVKKWTRNGKLGPIIHDKPELRKEEHISRVLYAPIYDPSVNTALQRNTKYGLREALEREFHVVEVDYYNNHLEVLDVADRWHPDIFIMQLQDAGKFNLNHFKYLQATNQNSVFINWNGDFHPEHILNPEYMEIMRLCHISTFVTTFMKRQYDEKRINWRYWQIGYEDIRNPEDGIPLPSTKKHDVLLLGNGYHAERVKLGEILRQIRGINVGIYGSWPKHVRTDGMNIYDFADGIRLYKNCKIAISDSRKEAPGFVSNRLFQSMAAGAFTLQQKIEGMEELIGFKDGVHLSTWTTFEDLKKKIEYWLKHEEERIEVARTGQLEVLKNHSFCARVYELETMMKQYNLPFHSKRNS
jgi:glycosyltransferase involved in cell wall biosynthesis